ncbi:MAG TPA: hypothetical protein VGH99_13305 [Pseudonocardia sp.]
MRTSHAGPRRLTAVRDDSPGFCDIPTVSELEERLDALLALRRELDLAPGAAADLLAVLTGGGPRPDGRAGSRSGHLPTRRPGARPQ